VSAATPVVEATASGLRGEITIAAPVARVARYVCDLGNMPIWWPEHRVYRRVLGDGGPGTLYVMVYQPTPLPVLASTVVEALEPGAFFAYYAGYPGVAFRIEYRFAAVGEGTRLEFTAYSFLLPPPAFGNISPADLERALRRLAQILEHPSSC
jgi:uncharacterized protein YndB with AHSA1/START domain